MHADTLNNVQAHLARPAKFPVSTTVSPSGYRTRDWSLFVFFRIMAEVEVAEANKRLLSTPPPGEDPAAWEALLLDLARPDALNAGLVEEGRRKAATGEADPDAISPDEPAKAFLHWLGWLVDPHGSRAGEEAAHFADLAGAEAETGEDAGQQTADGEAAAAVSQEMLVDEIVDLLASGDPRGIMLAIRSRTAIIQYAGLNFLSLLYKVRAKLGSPEKGWSPRPLAPLLLYELLRQGVSSLLNPPGEPTLAAIRSESAESLRPGHDRQVDRTPVTIAFSHHGLKALNLDPDTLASFPDAFKDGMAGRARRLRDTGASAPERWEGQYGLETVHGYFTTSSNLLAKQSNEEEEAGDAEEPEGRVAESFWRALRDEIDSFNNPSEDPSEDPSDQRNLRFRAFVGFLFRLIGLEIVRIEIGQDPYDVEYDKSQRLEYRKEHFGFRDGLSQPFVDLKLGDTLPGGGTPSRRNSWTPVAPGEIFLDRIDEGGSSHLLPVHEQLRLGSTYLVFRKLEQDVYGFRAFLQRERPEGEAAQHRLAAQFVGRWKNGTSLVRSPAGPRAVEGEAEALLNDFRYAADDPYGRKCPLGAHIRRANPRDTGGRNDVRHHRILRRGISFGGPLLREDDPDDGRRRGMLFVAACARVDIQFEVVQADWLNGGEFLGQVGLGRCPVTGTPFDNAPMRFLEAGALAPVSGLPRFVTMRGGEYFFAPGIGALKAIAAGEKFKPDSNDLPYGKLSMGDTVTQGLFGEARLKRYGQRLLAPPPFPQQRVIRLRAKPPPGLLALPEEEKIAFVGRHEDVSKVLRGKKNPHCDEVDFSVWPYLDAGLRITNGETFPVATDVAGPTAGDRRRLFLVLNRAWEELDGALNGKIDEVVRGIAEERLDGALRRTAGTRAIDLVDDLAVSAAYGVVEELFGVPGPEWLTELAAALPFSRQHVGELPPEWLAAFKGEKPSNPGLTTMQIWMAVVIADLVANFQVQTLLQAISRQAGTEALNHIDIKLRQARGRAAAGQSKIDTLIAAFVHNVDDPVIRRAYRHIRSDSDYQRVYFKDVSVILLEIIGATLVIVPLTFASVMTTLLKFRIDLPRLLPRLLPPYGLTQLIYEAERLTPNVPIRLRRCEVRTAFNTQFVERRDIVAALVGAANMDPRAFDQPPRFSLQGFCKGWVGPLRKLNNYLLFGAQGRSSKKQCWGQGRVAGPLLEECLRACGRLEDLQRVAGRRGEPQKLAGVTIGLAARFARVRAK